MVVILPFENRKIVPSATKYWLYLSIAEPKNIKYIFFVMDKECTTLKLRLKQKSK